MSTHVHIMEMLHTQKEEELTPAVVIAFSLHAPVLDSENIDLNFGVCLFPALLYYLTLLLPSKLNISSHV